MCRILQVPKESQEKVVKFSFHGQPTELRHGSVVIAAIISFTNTLRAGRGTCCTHTQGYYGPAISAISIAPFDCISTVSNRPPSTSPAKKKTGLIVGIAVGFMAICALFRITSPIYLILAWPNFMMIRRHISTRVAGTIGDLAPEYAMGGHLT